MGLGTHDLCYATGICRRCGVLREEVVDGVAAECLPTGVVSLAARRRIADTKAFYRMIDDMFMNLGWR